ncbi:MAG: SpvB/TcaC N-terminal domain-containing protein, partial [Polyangia bacterium]
MTRPTRLSFVLARLALGATCLLATQRPARAVLGVDDDRSSLPEGPGSVNGFADNADVSVATGGMTYSLPFEVPDGFAGATPSMSLAYSSGSGNGPWGMGWSVAMPSIERGTAFGLPAYTTDDSFYADGSEQLVRVDDTGATYFEYRARFENAFIRYRWHNPFAAASNGDYWTAELPDGSIRYFGADPAGTIDTLSREQGGAGTFKYGLVASVDALGNRVHYTWQQLVGTANPDRALESVSEPVLASIEYAFHADGTPRNKVVFGYEERPDAVSDCKAGFCAYLEHRTIEVSVFTGATKIRSYQLAYDPTPVASPLSRLRSRKVMGKDGGAYPAANAFDYTQALGVGCSVNDCGIPSLVTMTGAMLGA